MIISFEGIDGTGKSTQTTRLMQALESAGVECVLVNELRTDIGEKVLAEIHKDPSDWRRAIDLITDLRTHLYENVSAPVLDRGGVVIYDRYLHSTYAYQGYALGNENSIPYLKVRMDDYPELVPDALIHLKVAQDDLPALLDRIHARSDAVDVLETPEILTKTWQGLALALDDPQFRPVHGILDVDAFQPIHQSHHEILAFVELLRKSAGQALPLLA